MGTFWYKLLGIDAARIPEGAETHVVWAHAPRSWGVFVMLGVVAAAVYLVFALYRREGATCPRRVRTALAILRAAVVVVLALVFLAPALAVAVPEVVQPYVVLLLDDSLSMAVQDRYLDDDAAARVAKATGRTVEQVRETRPSRAELVDRLLLAQEGAFLRGLTEAGRVRVISFSDRVRLRASLPAAGETGRTAEGEETPLPRGEPVPPLAPSGRATDIALGLREARKALAGGTLAGIVLVSDGRNTEGDDPLAAAGGESGPPAPLFVLGLGDPAPPRNLRVVEVSAPESVFRSDPFLVQARVRAEGFEGERVSVELLERRADASADEDDRLVDRRDVAVVPGGDILVAFEKKAVPEGGAGEFIYTLRVRAPAGREQEEVVLTDNVRSVPVHVLSEQARVLLIAGSPSWDFRLVRTLLIRDKTIDVSCWLQTNAEDMPQDGDTVITRLPSSPDELFQYDVVLMLDPDPAEFGEEWMDLLRRFLGEHGGGLLWQAGMRHAARFLHGVRTRTIADLLPVRVSEQEVFDVHLLSVTHRHEWPLHLTAAGLDHPVLLLDKDPEANRRRWETVPGVYWCQPVLGAKPATLVLIEHSDPRLRGSGTDERQPLLVAGQYGPGRTLYVGFESTWRWRAAGEDIFDRFWVQAVRYLVEGRLLGGRKRGTLETDRDVYTLGDPIAVSARLYDTEFRPLQAETVQVTLSSGDGSVPLGLRAVPGRPGHYEGMTAAAHLGPGEIALLLTGRSVGETVRIARRFTVEPPRVELEDPRPDRRLLSELAARSGGRFFEIDEYADIPGALPRRQETVIVPGRPVELWDTDRLLLVLVGLLGAEWAVRKRFWLL